MPGSAYDQTASRLSEEPLREKVLHVEQTDWPAVRVDDRKLIDLPFAISPVVAGLVFVLLFGANGFLGGVVEVTGIRVINALPGSAAEKQRARARCSNL